MYHQSQYMNTWQQMSGPDSSGGLSIQYESEGWGVESPSGRDISVSKSSTLAQEHLFMSQKLMLLPAHILHVKY